MVRRGPDRRGAGADLFADVSSDVVTSAPLTSAPLTGGRNESSVLFSLATLGTLAKDATPAPPSVTESSSLIDLRALCTPTAVATEVSRSHASEIASLSGGGAFSALLAPPLVSFAVPEAAEGDRPPATRRISLAIGVAAVLILGAVAFAGTRRAASPPVPAARPIASETSSVADLPSASAPATSNPDPAPPSTAVAAPAVSTVVATRPRVARAPTQTTDAQPTTTASSAPAASNAKCCPGENETTCHMRLAVGAPCGDSPSAATTATAPPFDRSAATRALGVSVASCKRDGGPTGPGHVKVTFQPSGSASAVDVDAPYAGTPVGACVAQRFRTTTIPAFAGGPLTVGKSFTIP